MRPNSEHNPLHGSSGWGTSDGPSQRPVASSGGARLGEGGVEGADRRSAYDNAPSESQRGHKVGVWMLVGLIYYSVSGGPLGVEVAVRAGGPALALLGFLVMPVIWSAPEALMTAELSVAYPEAAGFSAWTNAAFGPFWSFMCSILSWFSGVLDNAVYPVLMLEYIQNNKEVTALPTLERWCAILVFTVALTGLTWRGLDVNGRTCIFLTAFVLAPFIVFTVVGLPQVSVSNWFLGPAVRANSDDDDDDDENNLVGVGGGAAAAAAAAMAAFSSTAELPTGGSQEHAWDDTSIPPRRWLMGSSHHHSSGTNAGSNGNDDDDDDDVKNGGWGDVKWRPLLNILFWNLNYYDSASAFSGDCVNPAQTFPRAMLVALIFVSLTYLVPLAVATGALPRAKYCDGCFVSIAADLDYGGAWLGFWITASAAVSCVGLFIAEMASDSFQLMGMADRGQLPRFLARRSRYDTPTYGIALSSIGVIALGGMDFTAIVEMVNVLYVFAEIIEFAAFVRLRQLARQRSATDHLHHGWQQHYDSTSVVTGDAGGEVRQENDHSSTATTTATAAATTATTTTTTCVRTPEQAAIVFLPASLVLLVIVALSSARSLLAAAVAGALTAALYLVICLARAHGWCAFNLVEDPTWSMARDPLVVQRAVAAATRLVYGADDAAAKARARHHIYGNLVPSVVGGEGRDEGGRHGGGGVAASFGSGPLDGGLLASHSSPNDASDAVSPNPFLNHGDSSSSSSKIEPSQQDPNDGATTHLV